MTDPTTNRFFAKRAPCGVKNFFLEAVTPKNDIFINFIYACVSSNLAGCQDYGAGGSREKEKNEI